MVKQYWETQEDVGIALTKIRIKHLEKHGDGDSAMQEKRILVRQERHKQLRKDGKYDST